MPSPSRCPLLPTLTLALLCAACLADASGGALALTVEVRARQFVPGEPVRIDILSPEPLERLSGSFLDQEVFLFSSGDDGRRWSGWALIALDQKPGLASVEVHGSVDGGGEALGTRAVTVEVKEFPEEHLSVGSAYVEPPEEVQERLARERAKLAGIYRHRATYRMPGEPFVQPVPGEPTSIFGTRRLFNGQPRSPHPGLDLRAAEGTPVASSGPGRVVLARELYYSGSTVIVDHGGGLFTLYAHLSRIQVDEGDTVGAGMQIGLSGATGRVTGPHLHWGAKVGDRPFDPTALLDATLF